MPPVCHFGPAAPSGLTRYASNAFGDAFRDNFFAALFNMQKVTRHLLYPIGATFRSRDSDFLVADSLDFHPTDVIEDADGSLLVVDTGAWYKLCCPTSQLAKPDVLGAIYRVRKRGAPAVADPRGQSIAWAELDAAAVAARLADARPAVQERAIQRLAALDAAAVPALASLLTSSASIAQRRNAVWALTRMTSPEARAALRAALKDRHESVQRAALHAVGVWRDRGAAPGVRALLTSHLPAVQRAAAEAAGRLGDREAVAVLLATAERPLDRIGEHSVTYALIEIADPAGTAAGLRAPSPRARRVALVALDQMPGGRLQAGTVVALLESPDVPTRDAAWRIAARHPEWGDALAGYFRNRLSARGSDEDRRLLRDRLAQFGGSPAIQALLAASLSSTTPAEVRAAALDVMAASELRELPERWVAPLADALKAGPADVVSAAVAVARSTPAPEASSGPLYAALVGVARNASHPAQVRLDAFGAVRPTPGAVDAELFALLRDSLQPSSEMRLRMAAADIVERAQFNRDQLVALVDVLRDSGGMELPRLLPAFDQGSDEALGLAMVAALETAGGRSNVRADVLRPRIARYPPAVRARGEALLRSLSADAAAQAERLERLLAGMVGGGDVRRGQSLFNSPKAACASCHAIGYRGGKVGPDLTAIGQIRSERDLLEAIVYPSASFARGYEPVVVTTTTGDVHGGILQNERADEVVVTAGESQQTRIPRDRVAGIQPGTVSVMPAGYADQLSRQELADLLAFLKGTRWGAN
jgi:putative heme-binding domain-containing protein